MHAAEYTFFLETKGRYTPFFFILRGGIINERSNRKKAIHVENMIYEIDGKEVMLDSDLANLYNVETKRINEAVKNNPEKFPRRFSWKLSIKETTEISRSKFSTLKTKQGTNIKYGARVFTEQGVYMLATILKSKVATEVSIRIMDTFVKMRHYFNFNRELLPNRVLLLEEKVDKNTKRIDELFDKFNPNDIIKKYLVFDGEFYDAYSLLLDIFNRSLEEVIIIDNYAGKELLDIIKDVDRKFIVVSKNINKKLKEKYEKQYYNVEFIENDSFHDRFIILDRNALFLCGSSFKDLGKKCFGISELKDKIGLKVILEKIGLK